MEHRSARREMGVGQLLGTLTLGATIGSLVALLYAPADGRTTRKRLKLKFKGIQRSAAALRDQAVRQISSARAWVSRNAGHGNGRTPRHAVVHH